MKTEHKFYSRLYNRVKKSSLTGGKGYAGAAGKLKYHGCQVMV